MKSRIKYDCEEVEIKYPCLMKSKNSSGIVLFTAFHKGTVVYGNDDWDFGEYCNQWYMGNFKLFDGEVILSND